MKKHFSHRFKWFKVYPTIDPNWPDDYHVIHLDYADDTVRNIPFFHYYIENEDKMYQISREDIIAHRRKYNGNRWHISKQWMVEVPIDAEWRQEINLYKEKLNVRGKQ